MHSCDICDDIKWGETVKYAQEQCCYPEGPIQARGMGLQELHEIQQGQVLNPAPGNEQLLYTVKAGECFSRKGLGALSYTKLIVNQQHALAAEKVRNIMG